MLLLGSGRYELYHECTHKRSQKQSSYLLTRAKTHKDEIKYKQNVIKRNVVFFSEMVNFTRLTREIKSIVHILMVIIKYV